jgi:hypothetical protein
VDLSAELPRLLPRAIAWAQAESDRVQASGLVLLAQGVEWARKVGVARPDLVRIEVTPSLPMPTDPDLAAAAIQAELLGPGMAGLTLGYSIFILASLPETSWTLVHELRHVHQYEQAGSIAAFLPVYLAQVVSVGYLNAPLEIDANEARQRVLAGGAA